MTGPSARTAVRPDHALIAPETHVVGPVPGWTGAEHVQLIGPALGAGFAMALVRMGAGALAAPPRPGTGRFTYILDGALTLAAGGAAHELAAGGYAYVPPDAEHTLSAAGPSLVCIIDKPYVPAPGAPHGRLVVGDAGDRPAEPMLGDRALMVRQLLPEEPALDLAVNLMAFAPGAALPFVEAHAMEHGLLVLEGTLVYRLADAWYPVGAGDAVWMGPFCPQWCCAYGPGPAEYLIYKDWNRDPLA